MSTKIRDGESFSKWYHEAITTAELVDQAPVRGCIIFRPNGYALWEFISHELDARIKKEIGAKNCYFPLFIPESFLKKEKEHVEGFSPELAVVTHGGGSKLEEPYVVRPTSETIIYDSFSRWISSYRDLPMKINQWANVVRWEMRPRPFVRTLEFLWQEGHTAHATEEEALQTVRQALSLYVDFSRNFLAIPAISGEKTAGERFAGAKATYTFEALMRDGKALQMGTSHLLAHSFPEAFGISFQDETGANRVPWCSSWGATTRLIGAAIMVHGDDEVGLILPPAIAPIQAAIITIPQKDADNAVVNALATRVANELEAAGIRVQLDGDPAKTPGNKFFYWESRGVPLRLEIGPRDAAKESVMMVMRLELPGLTRKQSVKIAGLADEVKKTLALYHDGLLARAKAFLDANTHVVATNVKLEELGSLVEQRRGFHQVGWCGQSACETRLKEIKSSPRVVVDGAKAGRHCFACGTASKHEILVARAY